MKSCRLLLGEAAGPEAHADEPSELVVRHPGMDYPPTLRVIGLFPRPYESGPAQSPQWVGSGSDLKIRASPRGTHWVVLSLRAFGLDT